MPGKNKILNGKYGGNGAFYAIQNVYTNIQGMEVDQIDKSIKEKILEDNGEKLPYMADLSANQQKRKEISETKYGDLPLVLSYGKELNPGAMSPDEHVEFIDSVHKKMVDVIKNPKKADLPFMGQYYMLEKMTDKTKDYTRAYYDNPYLDRFVANTAACFSTGDGNYTPEEIVEVFGKKNDKAPEFKSPLEYINTMHENGAKLFDLEYERHEVEDKKDPAMEKQYLIKLYNTINKTIDDFEEFHEFGKRVVGPKGESEYDKYMNTLFDMFTGVNK